MKKIILLLALCFTANNFFAQTTDPNQLKNEGNDALNAKNYAVAYEKYSEYLKLTNNQDSVTAYNCGVCADNIKKYNEAANYFDIAIKKGYNLANAYIGKSAAYRDMKNNKEYIATLAEGIKAVPGNATLEKLYAIYYLKEGQKFQQAGNIEKAEENYKHATDVSSKKWKTDALYSLGVLFYNNGASVLQKATPLANSNKEKYASEKAKADADFKKAVDYLGEAITLSPNRTEIKQMQDQAKGIIK